jgi:F-type H+-transporting ATPase subunit b
MPQLNPEFFISQFFWLVISFSFLFVFLWKISLPRISNVLEKRANKINEDVIMAKKLQAEAEEIQKKIDTQLKETKLECVQMLKVSSLKFQDHSIKKLSDLDNELNTKIDEANKTIEKNLNDSLEKINKQIYEITKLTLSKISNISASDAEIKEMVANTPEKANQ